MDDPVCLQYIAALRQISRNPLKRAASPKVGIQGNRPQAGWWEDYPVKVILDQDAFALLVHGLPRPAAAIPVLQSRGRQYAVREDDAYVL